MEVFQWGLPDGPRTPDDTFEDDFYALLNQGQCRFARDVLLGRELLPSNGLLVGWTALDSPRGVLLYYSAAQACLGEHAEARRAYERAASFGWQGVLWGLPAGRQPPDFSWDCEVLRSVTAVLRQVKRATVACPAGEPLRWPDADRKDNPLTTEVEAEFQVGGVDPGPDASPTPNAPPVPDASSTATATPSPAAAPTPAPTPTPAPSATDSAHDEAGAGD